MGEQSRAAEGHRPLNCQSPVKLQTKARKDFTITEKAPTRGTRKHSFVALCATCLNTVTCLNIAPCHNISTCGRRKSTRLVAVAGGLVTALGCLFTSFASQWHQVFIRQNISRAVSQNFTSPTRDNPIMISQPIVMNRFSKLLMILLSYPYLLNGQYYLVVK